VNRETSADGTLRLWTGGIEATVTRLRPGACLVVYKGYDDGTLIDGVLDALSAELGRHGQLAVFIDAGHTDGVTTAVREAWTRWMQTHRDLVKLTMLLSSRFMRVTVNVARHLSGFERMVILHERDRFEAAVEKARKG
jgi:hypothetical protein